MMGKPYKYSLTVSRGKDELSTVIVTATPEDIAMPKEEDKDLVSTFGPNNLNDPIEIGTRGYGFGIKAEVWAKLREAALPLVRQSVDSASLQKGSRREIAYKDLKAPSLAK